MMLGMRMRWTRAALLAVLMLAGGCFANDAEGPVESGLAERDIRVAEATAGERADGICLTDTSQGSEGIIYVTAHQVVDGQLGAACFGSEQDVLLQAWTVLSDIVPAGQLRDLAVFSGVTGGDSGDSTTLAFVQMADDDGSIFEMAVNLDTAMDDQGELARTLVHEFSHIFTAVPTELDRTVEPQDCDGYDNGEGCHVPGSVMQDWHDRFWSNVDFDASEGDQPDDAAERCELDAGYFGEYGATSPEEDFAEAFAAFVVQADAATDGQQERLDWIAEFPGFVEFRDRAAATGWGPQDNTFGACG